MFILVVEDSDVLRQLIVQQLSLLGHKVESANCGRAALQKVERSAFDLILMDIMMPNMDGIEATRRIRDMEGALYTPIIAVTSGFIDRDKCFAAGMDDYMQKPITLAQLQDLLKKWSINQARNHQTG